MAAPTTAYDSVSLNLATTTGTTQILPALALAAYNNDTIYKQKFFCDYLIGTARKDASGSTVNNVVGCVIEGSDNYKHHAAKRHSRARRVQLVGGQQQTAIVLNDSGLNTTPHTYTYTAGAAQTRWANCISLAMKVESSFYAQTTYFGYRYRVNGVEKEVRTTRTIAAQGNVQENYGFVDLGYTQGQTVKIQPFAYNEEGEYVNTNSGQYLEFVAEEALEIFDFARYSSIHLIGSGTTQPIAMRKSHYDRLKTLTENGAASGIMGYTDPYFTTPIPDGYYVGDNADNENKAYHVVNGEFRARVSVIKYDPELHVDGALDEDTINNKPYGRLCLFANLRNVTSNDKAYTVRYRTSFCVLKNGATEGMAPPSDAIGSLPSGTFTLPAGTTYVQHNTNYYHPMESGELEPDKEYCYSIVIMSVEPAIKYNSEGIVYI